MNSPIKDEDLPPLRGLPKLRTLILSQTKITDTGLEPGAGLTGLVRLELLNDDITDAGVEHLKDLTGLRELVLPAGKLPNGVTDNRLAKLTGLTELRTLDLSFNCSDKGLEHLKAFKHLQTLKLFGSNYTDKGLVNLKDLSDFRELKLFATQITCEGLVHLKGLQHLRVWTCRVVPSARRAWPTCAT